MVNVSKLAKYATYIVVGVFLLSLIIVFALNNTEYEQYNAEDGCEYLNDSYFKCINSAMSYDGKISCYEVHTNNFEQICGNRPETLIKWIKQVN